MSTLLLRRRRLAPLRRTLTLLAAASLAAAASAQTPMVHRYAGPRFGIGTLNHPMLRSLGGRSVMATGGMMFSGGLSRGLVTGAPRGYGFYPSSPFAQNPLFPTPGLGAANLPAASNPGYYIHTGLPAAREEIVIGPGSASGFLATGAPWFGRRSMHVYSAWGDVFWPGGRAYYPHYYPNGVAGVTCASPYWAYAGAVPGWIDLGNVYYSPPSADYAPVPLYDGQGDYTGWRSDDTDSYYLNQEQPPSKDLPQGEYQVKEDVPERDIAVDLAVKDIAQAWQSGDIGPLSKHIRPSSRVAVFLRGLYQYSLEAGDYLDMTKDAMAVTKTDQFTLDGVTRKSEGVYTVTGKHVYASKDGAEHTVYVSYVLERQDGGYYVTQVGTAPQQDELGVRSTAMPQPQGG